MEETKNRAQKKTKTPRELDVTKEENVKAKDYVEVECRFKGDDEPLKIKANNMVQAHAVLAKMAEERGLNYRKAFEYHQVIQ